MARSNRRSERRARRRAFNGQSEDVNPMDFLSNLSDAMLVLAVGIMVALVLHWNVDLEAKQQEQQQQEQQQEQVVSFQDDQMEDQDKVPETATEAGQVYYDAASDTYYIVGNDGQTQTVGE